jgi:uncharacterized RDD family membrane protein YckC
MNRFIVFILLLMALFTNSWVSGGGVGASSECRGAECLVSASSSVGSIFIALASLFFVLFYPRQEIKTDEESVVGIWRRHGAFLLDFSLILLVLSPFTALPLLIAEANYTGSFQWAFIREFGRDTDSIYLLPAVVINFAILFYYFYYHLREKKPTLGQYVLSYRVIDDEESTNKKPWYALRVLYSFLGLCVWPISVILALFKPKKSFWWDGCTNTKVIRVVATNTLLKAIPKDDS